MFLNTETDRINRLIIQGGRTGMTELQFFAAEIKEWKDSIRRRDQLTGDMYYLGKGRFMLTISTQELETQAPALLQQKLYLFLKEVF